MVPAMNITRVAAGALGLALVGGCSDTSAPSPKPEPGPEPSALPTGSEPVDLDPGDFRPTSDHPYFPIQPGQRWTYREVEEGATMQVVVTVSSETKQVANGVEAAIVRDTVSEDGVLLEDTMDWLAQDADGNVWYLGEDTAEFEDGALVTHEGSFEAGIKGAQPGVIMPANPEPGMVYRQEYYEGAAEDNGAVLALDQQAEAPAGHFDGALLTADTNALEPDVLEYKLYAEGVGVVLTLGISGGAGREELVSMETVDAATARAAGTTPLGTPYG
jgi:hypothetical protein